MLITAHLFLPRLKLIHHVFDRHEPGASPACARCVVLDELAGLDASAKLSGGQLVFARELEPPALRGFLLEDIAHHVEVLGGQPVLILPQPDRDARNGETPLEIDLRKFELLKGLGDRFLSKLLLPVPDEVGDRKVVGLVNTLEES